MFSFKYINTAFFGIAMLTIASCKKETEYAPYPYNEVQSLQITADGAEVINAAVYNDSLIVYWPSHLALPEKITPQIVVSDKATVTPASGTSVDFRTGTKFSVKAQSGAVKDYFLKVVMNQPPIQIAENEYTTYRAAKGTLCTFNSGTNARYIIRDKALSHFYIIDSTGAQTELALEFPANTQNMTVAVPNDPLLKMGGYKIKVTSGTQTFLSNNYIFGIIYPAAQKGKSSVTSSITVKRGENITLEGTGLFEMKEGKIATYDANGNEKELAKLELVSFTATTATYRVPADAPVGTWKLGDYTPAGANVFMRTSDYIGNWNWMNTPKVNILVDAPWDGSITLTITQ